MEKHESKEIPEADQSRVFWSGMWSESKEHNRNAEWQKKLKKITIKSRSAWLILRVWFLTKEGKSVGRDVKLQEEMEFRFSGIKAWQTSMNELLFNWIRFWMEMNNWLISWLMDERFYAKKIELKLKQWTIIDPSLVYHYCGSFWKALSLNICIREGFNRRTKGL